MKVLNIQGESICFEQLFVIIIIEVMSEKFNLVVIKVKIDFKLNVKINFLNFSKRNKNYFS